MLNNKQLLESLLKRETTNSYTKREKERLIYLSDDVKTIEDNTYLYFYFNGVIDYRITIKCNTEEFYDFTYLSIPNQNIIKKEMLDDV